MFWPNERRHYMDFLCFSRSKAQHSKSFRRLKIIPSHSFMHTPPNGESNPSEFHGLRTIRRTASAGPFTSQILAQIPPLPISSLSLQPTEDAESSSGVAGSIASQLRILSSCNTSIRRTTRLRVILDHLAGFQLPQIRVGKEQKMYQIHKHQDEYPQDPHGVYQYLHDTELLNYGASIAVYLQYSPI